jgi:ABC-2 type transport system permease protein
VSTGQEAAPLGPPIKGPTAFSGDTRRFLALTTWLAFMDFKVRYFGSALGYLWQLVRPLLLFGVLYVVFTKFVRFNEGVRYFPAILLTGIMLFTFFSDATSAAVTSVLDRENLVRKIQFPRIVVPLSVVLTAFFNLLVNVVAVMVFVIATGVDPHWTWALFPLIVLGFGVLAVGVSMLLSALYVRFRDVRPIWDVALQVLFYGSPILYALEVIPDETIQKALLISPIAAMLQQARHWLIDPTAPTAAEAIGGAERLLAPAGIMVGLFLLGLWAFSRQAPRIAEDL